MNSSVWWMINKNTACMLNNINIINNYQQVFLKYLTARILPAVLVQASLSLKPWPLIGWRLNQHDTSGPLFDSVNRSGSGAPDETVSVSLQGTRRRKASSRVHEAASPEPACKQHNRLFRICTWAVWIPAVRWCLAAVLDGENTRITLLCQSCISNFI